MWKLKHYLRPYWVWCVLAPLLMLVEVTMDLLQPTLMASIVDKGVMTKDLSHIFSTGLIMLGVAFIGLIGGVGCTIFRVLLLKTSEMICGLACLNIFRNFLIRTWIN